MHHYIQAEGGDKKHILRVTVAGLAVNPWDR